MISRGFPRNISRPFVVALALAICLFVIGNSSQRATPAQAAGDITWNFGENSGGTHGWNNSGWECQGFWGNPFWVLDPAPGGDPWIVNDNLNVDSWDYWAVEIRLFSRADSGDRIYWKTSHENFYSAQKSVSLGVTPDGTSRTIRKKLSGDRDLWIHNITGIRIDPAADGKANTCGISNDDIGVDWVKLLYDGTFPTNPTSVSPGASCAAVSNVWQNDCNNANFTWSGAADPHSGVEGYYYSWSEDHDAWPTNWTTTAGYNPGSVSSGTTHYLRVTTQDHAGKISQDKYLFTLKYDGTAPSNPTSVSPGCAATNNVWGTCSNANFTWSGASDAHSGIDGYYVYWGTSSSGNPVTWKTSAAHNPGAISSGSTYYLRVKTKDKAGNISAAKTLFTLKYDGANPTNPTNVNPGACAATDNVWGTCSNPNFTWSGASDAHSGVKGYYYYWGTSSSGNPTTWTTSAGYNPGSIPSGSTYYLRVKTEDNAGRTSSATTLFRLKYDGTAPTNPTGLDPGCPATSNVWGPHSNAHFTWSGASDAHSGVSGYYFYWGTSSSGVPVHWTTGTEYNPAAIPSGSTYYFRMRTKDNVGNESADETLFILKNDQTSPGNPTSVSPGASCAVADNVWQNVCNNANFTWSGASDAHSGVKGYYYYWGASSSGNPSSWTTTSGYDPPAASGNGVNYLRLKTEDNAGNESAATTLFTLKYDAVAPSNPSSISPGCTATSDVWQNTCDQPNFTWSGAADAHSGIAGYYVYWGISSTGTPTTYTSAASFSASSAAPSQQPYYLRLQTVDNSGNRSSVYTAFILKYDGTPTDTILRIAPPTSEVYEGEEFSVDVQIATPDTIDGAEVYVDFDPAVLQVQSLTPGAILPQVTSVTFDNSLGRITFIADTNASPKPTGTLAILSIRFLAKAVASSSSIAFSSTSPRASDVTVNDVSVLASTQGGTVNVIALSTIIGQVTPPGRPSAPHPRWQVPLVVTIGESGNSTPLYQFTPTTDSSGSFTVNGIRPAQYWIGVKSPNTLRSQEVKVLASGTNNITFDPLRAGDANDDNSVTLPDFSILSGSFAKCTGDGGFSANADFDGDACVLLIDFSLLASNFGTSGDQPGAASTSIAAARTQPESTATLYLSVSDTAARVNGTVAVTVWVNSGDTPVDGVAANIKFDPTMLAYESIKWADSLPIVLQETIARKHGGIRLVAGALTDLPQGKFPIATLQFRPTQIGETSLSFTDGEAFESDVLNAGHSILASAKSAMLQILPASDSDHTGDHRLYLPSIDMSGN